MKQNSFDGKSWYPAPLIPLTFLDTRNFLKIGRVSLRTFSVVWDNTFSTTNRDPPPLSTKYFHNRKFLKHRKVPPPKVSGVFRQKLFDGKFWYSPLFIQKLSRYRSFSETQHRGIPLIKISALWDKNFSTENIDTPPFFFINLLANDNFPKHSTGLFAYDVIRYCETKNFSRKIVIFSSSHPSHPKISSISEFFWNTEGFPYETFRHCETTNFL